MEMIDFYYNFPAINWNFHKETNHRQCLPSHISIVILAVQLEISIKL